ncbi:MAG: putative cytokinin oxidase [Labilithrix sp.]|nr:putative cytokinin oxidase [Labilithrix sp.]
MSEDVSRRRLLQGIAAGAVVLGFDPVNRVWVTEARADAFDHVPHLDGTLLTDAASRQLAADDYGHIIHRVPAAVLKPGSVSDVAKIVRFARHHRLKVAMLGQAHSNYGQAQVQGGIVIDSSTLSTIHGISRTHADVDAGVRWSDLVTAAYAQRLTPPVLTDYLDLSIGGTLSVGGVGGASQHAGAQADNVLELEVVTGEGDIEICSPFRKPDLFNLVLAGLGQCAIIVRAKVRLVPADTNATTFNFYYDDAATYVADQRLLVEDGRFDYLEGQLVATASGGWRYMIEAATFFTPPAAPDTGVLFAGLHDDASSRSASSSTYLDFAFRLAPTVAFLKSIGVWGFPHPWLSVFVPASAAASYIASVASTLTLADTGQGPVLFYPVKRNRFTRPLFRTPHEPVSFFFNLLRTAPPDPAVVAAMVAGNRALYEQARNVGGTRYAIGALPFSPADWAGQLGAMYPLLAIGKRRYDPDEVLTPGQGIFP